MIASILVLHMIAFVSDRSMSVQEAPYSEVMIAPTVAKIPEYADVVRGLPSKPQRLVVPLFASGVSLLHEGQPWRMHIIALATEASKHGVELWGSLSLVNWSKMPNTIQKSESAKFYEQAALTAFEPTDFYGYVRLANPLAQARIKTTLAEAKKILPNLKGVVLEGNMPYNPLLAYSDESRLDCIAKLGVDPIDLDEPRELTEDTPKSLASRKLIASWKLLLAQESKVAWREIFTECSGLKLKYSFFGANGLYRRPQAVREATMCDWLSIYEQSEFLDLHIRYAPENPQTLEDTFSSIKITRLTYPESIITILVPADASPKALEAFLAQNGMKQVSFARFFK